MKAPPNPRFHSKLAGRGLLLAVAALVLAAAGCSHDPNVVKHKYLESGNRYFAKSEYRAAAIQYQNAIRVDPKFEEARARLAQAYVQLGMWNGAYLELNRAVDENPDDLTSQLALGNLLLGTKQFHRAQDIAQTVLAKEPNNVQGRILLANSLAGLDDVEGSLREMQGAIQLAPSVPQSYLSLAYLQAGAQETAQAEASFQKAVELDPKSVAARLALGNFYVFEKRLSEASAQFARAIELEPQNPLPKQAVARLDLAQGQKDQAEKELEAAKRASPSDPAAYRLLGDFYYATGDLDKALQEYASLYREHPQDLFTEQNYIQLLIFHRDLDQAGKLNETLLKKSPENAPALIARAEILSAEQKPDEAISALGEAIKNEPDNAEAHYFLGAAFRQKGDRARAESEWRQALNLHPGLVEAQRALVALGTEKRDWDLVIASAEGLIAAEPGSAEGYLDRVAGRLAKGDASGAESDLQKAAQIVPGSPIPYARWAALRATQRRFAEAEKLDEQALDRDPNFVEALNHIVELDLYANQPAQALARAKTQAAKEPSNAGYQLTLARLYGNNREWDKAEAAAQEAVALNGTSLEALQLLGQIQQASGSGRDRAAATYGRVIQTAPSDPLGYTLLGQVEESRGDWQRARGLYQKALDLEPNYPPAANNLAYLMLEHSLDTDVALSLAEAARRGMPNSPEADDTLGWAYFKKGAYDSAVAQLQEAVKKAPQNASDHYHLGLAYAKLGESGRARAELNRALELKPGPAERADIQEALGARARN